jgi:hypothetical protein
MPCVGCHIVKNQPFQYALGSFNGFEGPSGAGTINFGMSFAPSSTPIARSNSYSSTVVAQSPVGRLY